MRICMYGDLDVCMYVYVYDHPVCMYGCMYVCM